MVSSRLKARVSMGDRPFRFFFPFLSEERENSFRSKKLMGTFRIKAMAAPTNSGETIPHKNRNAPITTSSLCTPTSSSTVNTINSMIRFIVVLESSISILPAAFGAAFTIMYLSYRLRAVSSRNSL